MIVLRECQQDLPDGRNHGHALRGILATHRTGRIRLSRGSVRLGQIDLLHMIGLLDRPTPARCGIDGHNTAELPDDDISRLRSETIALFFSNSTCSNG